MPGNLSAASRVPATSPLLKAAAAGCAAITLAACGVLRPAPARQPQHQPAPASRPAAVAAPSASGDVYALLPFNRQQLTAAAALAGQFTALYGTFRYDQPPAAYLARLEPLTTGALRAALAQGFTAPGLIQQRTTGKESAVSATAVTAIRDIAGSSVTFLVTARQDITIGGAASQVTTGYAVTVALTAGTWKVYAIELATAGQAGSIP